MARLINIGFGNVVNSRKIVAVVSPDAAPVKRMVQNVKGTRSLIDATQGRKTKAVIVTSDDYLVLSALQPETIAALVKNVKNIVGVKEASGNISQIAKVKLLCGDDIDLYSGNDDQVVPILSLGGIGVISVLSNVAPKETHNMVMDYLNGDVDKARQMQLKAIPLIDALFSEVNPIPVKKALNLMGWEAGPLRAPLTEMEASHAEVLKKTMKDFGIKVVD